MDPPTVSTYFNTWISSMGQISNLDTIPEIINKLVPIAITLAGFVLFLMLIAGGFQMLTSAGNPKAADAGKQRLTNALLGFLIIFMAYWLVQIVQIILGVNILNSTL